MARDYDKFLVPSLIPLDAEGERVRDVIPNLLEVDVILVPVSQIRQKDGACTAIAWREEFEMKEAEKMKKVRRGGGVLVVFYREGGRTPRF